MDSNLNSSSMTTAKESNETLPLISGFYRSRIYTSDISINPLIVACDPILTLVATLKTIEYPPDRQQFLEDLAHEIRAFEQHAHLANYPENIINDARYALCCLLDETIALTSAWGKNSGWLQNNLLTIFYDESYGGEHFFTIVDRARENITANLHLIELLYLCLSFGFGGKYRQTEHGKKELAALTSNLYQIICQYRRINRRNLFICDPKPKLEDKQNDDTATTTQIPKVKLPKMAIIFSLIISSIIYFGIYLKLHDLSKPLYPLIDNQIKYEFPG